jgi:hypothetical protein
MLGLSHLSSVKEVLLEQLNRDCTGVAKYEEYGYHEIIKIAAPISLFYLVKSDASSRLLWNVRM